LLREHFVTTRIAHDAWFASARVHLIAVGAWRPLGLWRRLDQPAGRTAGFGLVCLVSVAR
jgi:hypothetical protein